MGQELLPCRWCESLAVFVAGELSRPECWSVHCNNCEATGPVRASRTEAITAWNQRAGTPPDGGAEKLRDLLRFPSGQPRISLDKAREVIAALSTPPVGEIGALVSKLRRFAGWMRDDCDCDECVQCRNTAAMFEAADALEATFAAHQEEWKPIEEAPRDGTRLLLARAGIELNDGAYKPSFVLEARWGEDEQGWAWLFGNALDPWRVDQEHPPTHFRPLPDPPRGDKPEVGL